MRNTHQREGCEAGERVDHIVDAVIEGQPGVVVQDCGRRRQACRQRGGSLRDGRT